MEYISTAEDLVWLLPAGDGGGVGRGGGRAWGKWVAVPPKGNLGHQPWSISWVIPGSSLGVVPAPTVLHTAVYPRPSCARQGQAAGQSPARHSAAGWRQRRGHRILTSGARGG